MSEQSQTDAPVSTAGASQVVSPTGAAVVSSVVNTVAAHPDVSASAAPGPTNPDAERPIARRAGDT